MIEEEPSARKESWVNSCILKSDRGAGSCSLSSKDFEMSGEEAESVKVCLELWGVRRRRFDESAKERCQIYSSWIFEIQWTSWLLYREVITTFRRTRRLGRVRGGSSGGWPVTGPSAMSRWARISSWDCSRLAATETDTCYSSSSTGEGWTSTFKSRVGGRERKEKEEMRRTPDNEICVKSNYTILAVVQSSYIS